MPKHFTHSLLVFLVLLLANGCANIVSPTGGARDTKGPVLIAISPADSQLNTRVSKLELGFDEYINLAAPSEIQISPLLTFAPVITAKNKSVTVKIADSLLLANTTYTITFGNAIQDLHENNPFGGFSYIFSTGSYFDSLSIKGKVFNAASGLPDTTSFILLYETAAGDSAIVKQKPLYISHVDGLGNFDIRGLPGRAFSIFALRDGNGNLTFDGGDEWVAFQEAIAQPGDSAYYQLQLFPEINLDTAFTTKTTDAIAGKRGQSGSGRLRGGSTKQVSAAISLSIDTSVGGINRSQELNKPLYINFANKPFDFDSTKLFLSYTSNAALVEAPIIAHIDSTDSSRIFITTAWQEDALYTLRLQKGFVKDSTGGDYLPGKFPFTTKREADYATLQVNVPTQYYGKAFLLQVTNGADTLYNAPILDSVVKLKRLQPGGLSMLIVADENENGQWDTGDVLARKQPETVIPYNRSLNLKAGWENLIDFLPEKKKSPR